MDEEAVKKNTDCVYFLASPLTCKKGSECQFRHSESARVNPRDCRYWLGGNCLNWDCPFRHPPLEGRAAVAAAPVAGGASKSRVPCYFFSQGYCAKGEKCPFMHGTPTLSTAKPTGLQRPTRAPPGAAESNDKQAGIAAGNGAPPKPISEQVLDTHLATEVRPAAAVLQSNVKEGRTSISSGALQNGGARGRSESQGAAALASSRLRLRQVQAGDDRVQNGMEPEEWWGEESSPGFDVLVDDGPEQSRYPDDPEFQSAHESGLEPGKAGSGGRGRGRAMHMADEVEQFDYDYPSSYDHATAYETGAQYEHGGYDYKSHDQQMGYDPSNTYDRIGHQRTSAYGDRGPMDDLHSRERQGIDGDVRGGVSNNDHRTRIVKRGRADGGLHATENTSRRQRTEIPLEEYQQHQRQQEDQQKQMELQLRHQLFIQHGMRNTNRRSHEKTSSESGGVARRALQDIGAEVPSPPLERVPLKSAPKARSLNDYTRTGMKDHEHSKSHKVSDSFVEAEARGLVDSEVSRKSEVKKEPSNFAGPKSLAQIKAEKMKGGGEELPLKAREVVNGPKKAAHAGSQHVSKGSLVRSTNPTVVATATPAEAVPIESVAGEDRKIRLGKVVSHELKKAPNFEGPKSLSAILREKRKFESESDSKQEDTSKDYSQRVSHSPTSGGPVGAEEPILAVDLNIPELDAELDDVDAEVEDGEFLSEEEPASKSRSRMDHYNNSHAADPAMDVSRSPSRDRDWQEDHLQSDSLVLGRVDDEDMGGVRNSGVGRVEEELEYTEVADFEDDAREEVVEPGEDEDGFVLEDDEEDDFAKKLGGFFS